MSTRDIICAWKDELFRNTLSQEEQARLPKHPSGEIMLTTEEMAKVNGGAGIVWTDDPGPFGCTSTDTSIQQAAGIR